MNCEQILSELQAMGSDTIKRIFKNHGAKEPIYGVKVEDMKKIQKRIKKNYELSLELYQTGISDAQYLAGLIADETKMTKSDLQNWANDASWYMLSESTVPWVAAESPHGYELAMEWIESESESIQAAGWSTLANLVSIVPDEKLPVAKLKTLLQRVEKEIHQSPNRVRYAMNGFVIALGAYIKELTSLAKETGKRIGTVLVDMGGTACKVPYAPDYIQKVEDKGKIGQKKRMARC